MNEIQGTTKKILEIRKYLLKEYPKKIVEHPILFCIYKVFGLFIV